MSVVEVQMRLGHKRASTTLGFYGHLLGDPNREVADKLEKSIAKRLKSEKNGVSCENRILREFHRSFTANTFSRPHKAPISSLVEPASI